MFHLDIGPTVILDLILLRTMHGATINYCDQLYHLNSMWKTIDLVNRPVYRYSKHNTWLQVFRPQSFVRNDTVISLFDINVFLL